MKKKCSIDGCENNARAKGLCWMHYYRQIHGISDMRSGELPRKWKPNDPRYKNKGRFCSVYGCNKPFYAKDLCRNHYELQRRHGRLIYKRDMAKPICSVEGCNEVVKVKGLCMFHYNRWRHGIELTRPKGIKGKLNPHWKGGVAAYTNHTELKRIRKEILAEANYKCHYCGKPANQVHHVDLTKWNHSKSNLVACCTSCNHKRSKIYTSKFRRLYGKTASELAQELGLCAPTIVRHHNLYGSLPMSRYRAVVN